MYIKKCLNCGKEFESETHLQKYCSHECLKIYESKRKHSNDEVVICKECGYTGKNIQKHITSFHNMTIEEYCSKHNCQSVDLLSKAFRKQISEAQKERIKNGRGKSFTSENNPSHNEECKKGRNSPYSMNFRKYDGLTDDEKKEIISQLFHKQMETRNNNHNNPTRLDYYTTRGYSLEEAKIMLKNKQTTFSLNKCIEKYSEEEGTKIWKERQEKWQNTLNSKSPEEMERILKAKMFNGIGYSKISQELFWDIYNLIKNKYKNIHFATLKNNTKDDSGYNNEYIVFNNNKHYLLDFLVEDTKKVIEFDGEYWHNRKKGQIELDLIRQKELEDLGYIFLRIQENDYRMNPEESLQKCYEFLCG